MKKRLINAWRAFTGEATVEPQWPHPYKFIQLVSYMGGIIALDGLGRLYWMEFVGAQPHEIRVTFVSDNPVEYGR